MGIHEVDIKVWLRGIVSHFLQDFLYFGSLEVLRQLPRSLHIKSFSLAPWRHYLDCSAWCLHFDVVSGLIWTHLSLIRRQRFVKVDLHLILTKLEQRVLVTTIAIPGPSRPVALELVIVWGSIFVATSWVVALVCFLYIIDQRVLRHVVWVFVEQVAGRGHWLTALIGWLDIF